MISSSWIFNSKGCFLFISAFQYLGRWWHRVTQRFDSSALIFWVWEGKWAKGSSLRLLPHNSLAEVCISGWWLKIGRDGLDSNRACLTHWLCSRKMTIWESRWGKVNGTRHCNPANCQWVQKGGSSKLMAARGKAVPMPTVHVWHQRYSGPTLPHSCTLL